MVLKFLKYEFFFNKTRLIIIKIILTKVTKIFISFIFHLKSKEN